MMDVRKRINELMNIPVGMTTREQMLTLAREVKEEAKKISESEEVPASGHMPPEIIEHVLAGDSAYVEQVIIAAVVATKHSIAKAIEAEIKVD